jgi:prepilin-type processing-associated H-X9-DG protein
MLRYSLPLALATSLFAASLIGQGAPTFVPKPHLMRCAAEDVPKLLEQLQASAVGKLLADAEVAAAFATGLEHYRELANRREAVLTFARTHEIELEPWVRANFAYADGHAAVRQLDLADMQRIELCAILAEEQPIPHAVVTLSCRPRAEGRWTALFERYAKAMADSKQWKQDAEAKFGGFPVWLFAPADGGGDQAQMGQFGDSESTRAWLLHLPGLFAFGSHSPDACGVLADPSARPPAQVVGEMDLTTYVAMFKRLMGGAPSEFTALGFDTLTRIQWCFSFDGSRILDEIEVELVDEPKGLVGALLAGKAALPAQPLPAGALAQLRCGVDLPMLLECAQTAGLGQLLPDQPAKLVRSAFTGGVAIGVCAPAPGGMIPRVYLSLGIADEKAAGDLLASLVEGGKTKEVTYEDVPCTVLELPGAPPALQPSWCRIGGALHVAESPLSLRAFLKARAEAGDKGGDAMDVGDAPLPKGAGDLVPSVDVRCDEQQLYSTFHKVWLPLLKLVAERGQEQPLLGEKEMPSPDAVLPHLGKSRGVLRRDGKVFRLQQLGALGGVEAAALAMVWGPFLSGLFHSDWTIEQVESAIGKHQLQTVWAALETFQKDNKRWPNDLAELFADKKLPVDALLMPGDGKAEVVALPAGDTRTVKASFRYFKDGVEVNVNGNRQKMLLIGIAPRRHGRPMLGVDGSIPEIWGEDSTRVIQAFVK